MFVYSERRLIRFVVLHSIKSIFQSLHQPRWEIVNYAGGIGNWYHYLSSLLWGLSRLVSQIIATEDVFQIWPPGSAIWLLLDLWTATSMTPVARLPIGPCSVSTCLSPPSCDAAYAQRQSLREKASRQAGREPIGKIDLRQLHWGRLHLLDCFWLL